MSRLLLLLPLTVAAAAATPIQPGKWETTITIVDVRIPGAPPGIAAMMRGRPTKVAACVTPADAANGPRAASERTNGRCRYTSYDASNGRITSTMVCKQSSGDMTFRTTGTYTGTSISLDGVSTGTGTGPMGAMTMKTHTESRRIGAC